METDKCKVLLTILELGSITEAANRLGYTTSGVSRMIASMEQEAGFPLLIRSRRGILPTDACKGLMSVFQEMTYLGDKYVQTCAQIQGVEIGEIRIGTSYRRYYPLLTKLITEFVHKYPKIKVHLSDGNSSELINAMDRHRIDCCIISKREGDFEWITLEENPIVAWLPSNHSRADSESIPIELFETEPYIETYSNQDTDNARLFKANKIKPNICYSTSDNYATYSMVEAGLGISMNNGLNSVGWQGDVVIKTLEPAQLVTIGMAFPTLDTATPSVKKFIDYAKVYFQRLL